MKLFDYQWVRSGEEKDSLDLLAVVETMTFTEWLRLVFQHRLRFIFTRHDSIVFHQKFVKAQRLVMLNLGSQDEPLEELSDDIRRAIVQAYQVGVSKDPAMLAATVADVLRGKGYIKQ